MQEQIEQGVYDKIDAHIQDLTELFISSIEKDAESPISLFLYDQNATPYAVPPEEMYELVSDYKPHFKKIITAFIEHLEKTEDVKIIKSAVFQEVFYKKMTKEEDENRTTNKASEMEGHQEGFLITTETADQIDTILYEVIFTHDKDKAVVSGKPVENTTTKKVKDYEKELSSFFTGIIK